ncbi:MAG: GldM family protein [Bacteroidota bacterium]
MKNPALLFCLLVLPFFGYAQESGVVPLGNNFFYRGLHNPIKVIVEGYSCDSLVVTSNMTLRRSSGCKYTVVPMNQHTGIFKVSALNEGDTVFIGQHKFRLLTTPDPVAHVDGSYDGRINIGVLNRARRIEAKLDDFIYEADFRIKSFTALIEKGDSVIYKEDITGEMFTTNLQSHFRELGPVNRVVFENIKAAGPADILRELDPLRLTIR